MNSRKGIIGSIISAITILAMIGLFLAVLAQFDGDLGAMFKWVLDLAWTIVSSVRDSVSEWDTFKGLFG